jgi:hypothetical protein
MKASGSSALALGGLRNRLALGGGLLGNRFLGHLVVPFCCATVTPRNLAATPNQR